MKSIKEQADENLKTARVWYQEGRDDMKKDVLGLIDKELAKGIDVINGRKYNLLINGEELKKRIKG